MSPAAGPHPDRTWVAVCTYQRPELLDALLRSLRQVSMPDHASTDAPQLIVVDNAPQSTLGNHVASIYPEAMVVHEPTPGISAARNASVQALPADADAVIFIDDDEQVTPRWFTELLACAQRSGADAVSGPVLPLFEAGEPQWLAEYGFVRRTDFPTGPHQRRLATNNTLVRATWFADRGYRFDEAFSFTGGEDSDLFERMMRAGAQFWWCAEAVVTEHVPEERATKEWLRQRAVRGGAVRAAKLRKRYAVPVALTRTAAEGLGRIGYGVWRRRSARWTRKPVTYTDDYYLCEGLGMLYAVTGRGHAEYARSE